MKDCRGNNRFELILTVPWTDGGRGEDLGLELHLANVGEGAMLSVLVHIGYRLTVLLLVVDERRTIRPGPVASVALVRMLPSVAPPVVYQVVRPLQRYKKFRSVMLSISVLYLP